MIGRRILHAAAGEFQARASVSIETESPEAPRTLRAGAKNRVRSGNAPEAVRALRDFFNEAVFRKARPRYARKIERKVS